MINENILVKIYQSNFLTKQKYSIEDFIDINNLKEIIPFASGYRSSNYKNKFIDEDLKKLEIPSFYKNNFILTKDLIICAQYIYLDLYILIQKFNLRFIDIIEFKENLYSYFKIDRKRISYNSKNNNFLISNKQSIELPRDEALYPSLDSLREDLGVIVLEIPFNYKREETFEFLKETKQFLNKINLKKLAVNFRIRKILKLKKNGMFIVNGNTLVIDPRRPEKVIHELGHYIYENGLAFNLNNKRIYKHKFENIINKNQSILIGKGEISKYEDYSRKSEIFAYWFESQFKSNQLQLN